MRAADQDARAAGRDASGCGSPTRSRAASAPAPGASASRSAPWPAYPRQIRPRAGAATTPATGVPSSIERDVDGELVAAGEKFAGAVERIDEDEAPPELCERPVAAALSSDTTGTSGQKPRQALRG